MTFNYDQFKRATLDAVSHIGRVVTPPECERGMSASQIKHRRGTNFMTDERWQYRALNGGKLIVEISYGFFLKDPIIGLTVYCLRELADVAPDWDHGLSDSYSDTAAVAGRLAELNTADRDGLAALVAAKG